MPQSTGNSCPVLIQVTTRVGSRAHRIERVVQRLGGGGDTSIPSPGWSPEQPLPRIGLHDPLHGLQACPEFNSAYQGVGQICPQEGLFSRRSLPERGQICDMPDPPQSFNDSKVRNGFPTHRWRHIYQRCIPSCRTRRGQWIGLRRETPARLPEPPEPGMSSPYFEAKHRFPSPALITSFTQRRKKHHQHPWRRASQ